MDRRLIADLTAQLDQQVAAVRDGLLLLTAAELVRLIDAIHDQQASRKPTQRLLSVCGQVGVLAGLEAVTAQREGDDYSALLVGFAGEQTRRAATVQAAMAALDLCEITRLLDELYKEHLSTEPLRRLLSHIGAVGLLTGLIAREQARESN